MIKITVTPPNQPSFSQEFSTVSDAYDFLEILRVYGYEAAQQSAQRTALPAEPSGLTETSAQNDDWLNEPMCGACGHSKSRHQTAGGFCKHCTCNEFVEPATAANR